LAEFPEASDRLATTGEDIPPIVTGGMKERRTGLGIVRIEEKAVAIRRGYYQREK
jgi:hypothetical protein